MKTHATKSVANEGEVIVDNDRVVRERNPELDKLMEYLSQMSELMHSEEDQGIKNSLWLGQKILVVNLSKLIFKFFMKVLYKLFLPR